MDTDYRSSEIEVPLHVLNYSKIPMFSPAFIKYFLHVFSGKMMISYMIISSLKYGLWQFA